MLKRKLFLFVLLILAVIVIVAAYSHFSDKGSDMEIEKTTTETAKKDLNKEKLNDKNSIEDRKITSKSREIMDQNGRKVTIPAKVENVVTTRILPFPSVYFLANGNCQGLVGIHPASKSAAEVSMLAKLAPEILNAETGFINGDVLNIEELLSLNPDLVYFLGTNKKVEEEFNKLEVPAVAIQTMALADGNSIETLSSWLKLLGSIGNNEERAEKIIRNAYEATGMIESRIWNIPKEEKPGALILFNHGNKQTKVSGNHFFGQYWLEATGARNVAEDLNVMPTVDMEQIYKWDPEIIYITNFSTTMPEDLYQNAIQGEDWSTISAVKNKRVYKIPLGVYRWFPPSADTPLMLKWMATKNQPELFQDINMDNEIREFYKEYYSYELNDEEIRMILNPVREGAKGY